MFRGHVIFLFFEQDNLVIHDFCHVQLLKWMRGNYEPTNSPIVVVLIAEGFNFPFFDLTILSVLCIYIRILEDLSKEHQQREQNTFIQSVLPWIDGRSTYFLDDVGVTEDHYPHGHHEHEKKHRHVIRSWQ